MIVYDAIFKRYGFSFTQQEIIRIVGKDKIVLEIGSSTGYMTKVFLENNCTVDVIESDEKAVAKLPKHVRRVFSSSVEDDGIDSSLANYDFIIMADVLEHLVNPEQVLKRLLRVASSNTKLLISVPNIACWSMRKQLFFKGDFKYQENGLLDKTHLHFYTVNTLPKILLNVGWHVDMIIGTITRLPLEGLVSRIPMLGWFLKTFLYSKLVEKYKNLAYYHFLVITSKK